MAASADDLSREPMPDPAEDNAFFPSLYSLSQYTTAKTDFAGVKHKNAYTGGRWKVLMIAAEERYVLLEDGKMFSTGNHPIEMLLPLHHLMEAGFQIDVATLSGYPAKLELWAMPREDHPVSWPGRVAGRCAGQAGSDRHQRSDDRPGPPRPQAAHR